MTVPLDDSSLIYLDDELVPVAQAKVSVFDHAFLYGDGVFETFRVVDGCLFRMEEHLDRLQRSAKAIALSLPGERSSFEESIVRTVEANHWPMCFVKAIVTRGAGSEPLLEHTGLKSRLVVIARPSMPFFEDGAAAKGLSAAVVGTRKTPAAALDPRIKSLNYLNVIKARIEARDLGADEALLLDDGGHVVEGSIYNVIAVHGNRLSTPRSGCLEGITLSTVLDAAREQGFQIDFTDLFPYDLECADEVIFTSTAVGVLPVTSLNGRPVGSGSAGPVFHRLLKLYERALNDPSYRTETALAKVGSYSEPNAVGDGVKE
jgi:branched-chain amino acid aminotransferase